MIVDVDGRPAHAATGGTELAHQGPVLVLIHGAGMDSTVWQQQTRFLAHRGIRTLAIDLPGHGRSEGEPLESVSAMAEWLAQFVSAAGLAEPAAGLHLAGHSMGTFVALQMAADHPDLVKSLLLFGTADAMAVHPELLEAAAGDLPRAAALMAAWSLDKPAHVGLNPTPGMWMVGGARALVENSAPGALSADFGACMGFDSALSVAGRVVCPVTVVSGLGDKMTTPSAGRRLADALTDVDVIELPSTGHMMMLESPRAVRRILHERVTQSAQASA